ncbi:MAG: hypothetical protein R3B83_12045 [Nitrospirales bacterium]|nr:hypothetical protein [Nitrospirales bacterium]
MSKKETTQCREFKAKVALEAIKGIQTLQQLAKEFQVHPTQITMWKKQVSSRQWPTSFKGEAPREPEHGGRGIRGRPMRRLAD